MTLAVKTGKHTPAVEYLDRLTSLINSESWKEAADSFAGFEKEHPTAYFGVVEALPFRVQNHFVSKLGSTQFSIYSLRNITWSTDVVQAFEKGGDAFEAFIRKLENEVASAKPAPKA